ncbi:DUF3489 domain-containing protein [Roseomonas indoligenes]|uniref:DUF3489 domain-containing protein n=1 Tax=Roseomonas indoligenes TaxID=2820811 RepID=A0A940S8X2_9PROT|nr:DUF3489 domain-containing protein [Pararoseomonas indoligenes]MBP0496544.1 DUF3489 domain-containing protein [Pararoseomonas indoligenes]
MTKPVSPTQAQILASATQHPKRLAEAPPHLPAAARNAVVQSMRRAGLLEEMPEPDDGTTVLRITAAGLEAVGAPCTAEPAREADVSTQEGGEGQPGITAAQGDQEPSVAPASLPPPWVSLRDAAIALLVAWDAGMERSALPASIEALRAALSRAAATRPPRDPSVPRRPREGTKHHAVRTLLRREDGATIAGIMDATGWAQHTVRGFLAGLKKKGHAVEVLERVRQVGPGAQGAKGSYSVYRIAPVAAEGGQG